MKHSHKKSFDWYSMQQRYSIRKYYFLVQLVSCSVPLWY